AVAAARAAFPAWRSRSTIERARWLFGFRQVLEAHQDEVARSITREMGKTFADARAEVGRAIEMVEAASAVPQTMQGRVLENVALPQELVFNLIHEHGGLPDGVLNLVNGSRDVVNGILDHPGIDAVSFVGSAAVARYVYERAAAGGKRVQALGGAKNFMVVM